MSDSETLQAENERLRNLLVEHDISPDVEPEEPPPFGPPTEWEWRMQQMFARSAQTWANALARDNATRAFLEGPEWPPHGDGPLSVNLPSGFKLNRIG